MKAYYYLIVLLLLNAHTAYAQQPIINHNVTVMVNSSPSQCTANWSGSAGQEDVSVESGYGTDTGTAVSIQSCTGCSFDSKTSNCVCQTCYTNY